MLLERLQEFGKKIDSEGILKMLRRTDKRYFSTYILLLQSNSCVLRTRHVLFILFFSETHYVVYVVCPWVRLLVIEILFTFNVPILLFGVFPFSFSLNRKKINQSVGIRNWIIALFSHVYLPGGEKSSILVRYTKLRFLHLPTINCNC